MRADGTILGRKFINFSSDKDHLYHVLGRIRRFQREHSSRQVQSRWDYAKRLNMELSRKIAAEITKYAAEYQADVIVFEYLEMQGKISGKKKQKLHLWRKRDIQKLCEHQAHRNRIRVSRVSARNTSRLACDGSGAVVRIRRTIAYVSSRQESSITVICQQLIISGEIFYTGTFKTLAGNGKVFTGGKSTCSEA